MIKYFVSSNFSELCWFTYARHTWKTVKNYNKINIILLNVEDM
jgi:hypothetical protein